MGVNWGDDLEESAIMKTLNVHDKNPNEISSLIEQFIDTDERPIQIITNYEEMTGKTRENEILLFV